MSKIVPTSGQISVSKLNQIKAFKAPWSTTQANTSLRSLLTWYQNNSLDSGNTLANRSTDAMSSARGSSVMRIAIKVKAESNTTYDNSANARIHITCYGGDENKYRIEIDTLNGSDNINHETTGTAGQTVFDFSSSLGLGGSNVGSTSNYYKIKIESPPSGGSKRRMSLCVRPGVSGINTNNSPVQGYWNDFWLDVETDNPWVDISQNKPRSQGGATIFMGRFAWSGGNSSDSVWSNPVYLWSEPHQNGGGSYAQGVGCIAGGYINT